MAAATRGASQVGAESRDPFDLDDLPYAAQNLVFTEDESGHSRDREALLARARQPRRAAVRLHVARRAGGDATIREGRPLAAYGPAVEAVAVAEAVGGWRELWAADDPGASSRPTSDTTRRAGSTARAAALAPQRPATVVARLRASRARACSRSARGDVAAASRDLERAVSLIPIENPGFFGCEPDLVEALVSNGDEAAGVARLADLEVRARHAALPRQLAACARCRLLVAGDGELDTLAADALAAAGQSPLALARTRLVYGERLRRAGRRVDAREQLTAALTTFERLGAAPWAAQARRELQASGATLRRRDSQATEVLTPQELQVAIKVAAGMTNREVGAALFISPKTVELHLSRVYRKLGIRSRTELARLHAVEPERLTQAT